MAIDSSQLTHTRWGPTHVTHHRFDFEVPGDGSVIVSVYSGEQLVARTRSDLHQMVAESDRLQDQEIELARQEFAALSDPTKNRPISADDIEWVKVNVETERPGAMSVREFITGLPD
jgi:hypothetical protein